MFSSARGAAVRETISVTSSAAKIPRIDPAAAPSTSRSCALRNRSSITISKTAAQNPAPAAIPLPNPNGCQAAASAAIPTISKPRPVQATPPASGLDSVLGCSGTDLPAEEDAEECATTGLARLIRPRSITFTAKSNSHLPKGLALHLDRQSKINTTCIYRVVLPRQGTDAAVRKKRNAAFVRCKSI